MVKICDRCDGMGYFYEHRPVGDRGQFGHSTHSVPCPDCGGTGVVKVAPDA